MPGFFDKMKSTITEKGMEATIRAKEAVETQQAKGKIGELEGQKKKVLFEIGEAVYAMYQASSFDQETLSAQCQVIVGLEAQIKEKEAELEEIHKRAEAAIAEQKATSAAGAAAAGGGPAAFCPNCGTATQGAKFCPNCGSKIG